MVQNDKVLEAISQTDRRCVLATIIRVEGSAYRKEGVSMLLMEDGTRIGLLSGGCLENDLLARVDELLQNGASRTIIYDMRNEDDFSWGKGAGCNGLVHVLVETVHPRMREHLCMVKHYIDLGVTVTSYKKLNEEHAATDYLFIPHNGQEAFGVWAGNVSDVTRLLRSASDLQKSGIRYLDGLSAEVFVQTYTPKRRLILFGAGEDAKPLAAFAARVGFQVTIVDSRSALCNELHSSDADDFVIVSPSEVEQRITFTRSDSAVVMTHQFEQDKELLQILLRHRLNYLGVLGPRHRTTRLLDGCAIPDWVHSPVGLPIGAEGPEEIAISIVADLIRTQQIHPEGISL